VEFIRFDYDIEKAAKAVEDSPLPMNTLIWVAYVGAGLIVGKFVGIYCFAGSWLSWV